MNSQMMIGALLVMATLAGCATTEGQHLTDAFVAEEMSRRGVESSSKTTHIPDRILVAPSS